jgi:hypothetical protein
MDANVQRESISLLQPTSGAGQVSVFRQGFWAAKRPVAGPVQYIQTEYAARNTSSASTEVYVLLHSGYQVAARDYRATHITGAPTVILPGRFHWEGTLAATDSVEGALAATDGEPADWWNPGWHYAVPVTVAGPWDPKVPQPVLLQPDLKALLAGRGELDWSSPRAVVQDDRGFTLLPTACSPDTGEVAVELSEGAWQPGESRQFRLYFDTLNNGPKRVRRAPGADLSSTLRNGSFEATGEFWNAAGVTFRSDGGHTGPGYARLDLPAQSGTLVTTNRTMRLLPQSTYRVRFWARTQTLGAALTTNFYHGAEYDFPQAVVPLTPDGQWHEYAVDLPTRDFPPAVTPELRFWVLGRAQRVDLDDISVELIHTTPQAQSPVSIGALLAG